MPKVFCPCLLISLLSTALFGQSTYRYDESVPLVFEGDTARLAWQGGLNSPQFNAIDLNADGDDDLVLYERTTARLITYLWDGTRYQFAPSYIDRFPSDLDDWLLLRDMDCDGDLDLFTHTIFGIKVYEQVAPFSWQLFADPLLTLGSSGEVNIQVNGADYPAIEDLDGDGDLDVLIYNFATGETLRWYRNVSDDGGACRMQMVSEDFFWGQFRECLCSVFAFGGQSCQDAINGRLEHAGGKTVFVFDQDGDGDREVIIGQEQCDSLYYLENVGSATDALFTAASARFPDADKPVNLAFPSLFSIDFDHDGTQDLIASTNSTFNMRNETDFSETVWTYRGQSDGSFTFGQNDFLQGQMLDVGEAAIPLFADVDQDGDTDLLVSNWGNPSPSGLRASLYLFLNVGSQDQPSYRLQSEDFLGINALGLTQLQVQATNLDANTQTDLLLFGRSGNQQQLFWAPNALTGDLEHTINLADLRALNLSLGIGDVIWPVDVGSDGLPDLLVGKPQGRLEFYRNNGTAGAPAFELFDNSFLEIGDDIFRRDRSVWTTDLDQDGRTDLLTADITGDVLIYYDLRSRLGAAGTADTLQLVIGEELVGKVNLANKTWGAAVSRGQDTDLVLGTRAGGLYWLRSSDATPVNPGEQLSFLAYPNPSTELTLLRANVGYTLELWNLQGRQLLAREVPAQEEPVEIDLRTYPNGLYIIRATHPTLGSVSQRLVLNH